MKKRFSVTIIALTFIWIGLILGISFVEAPLKFQAPGITLGLGLGIGKLVFGMLTKIEMAISLFIIAFLLLGRAGRRAWIMYSIPLFIVVVDNALLMPILNERTDIILSGSMPPESSAHLWYVFLELLKLMTLLMAGISFTRDCLK